MEQDLYYLHCTSFILIWARCIPYMRTICVNILALKVQLGANAMKQPFSIGHMYAEWDSSPGPKPFSKDTGHAYFIVFAQLAEAKCHKVK